MSTDEHHHERIDVRLDEAAGQFVVEADGQHAGLAEFVRRGDHWVFTHTEIDPAHEGEGLGSILARAALDHVRAAGDQVVPLCPFIQGWIDRHPEYDASVDHPLTDRLRAAQQQ